MRPLSLAQRLANSRQWLLAGHLSALEMRDMGADPVRFGLGAEDVLRARIAETLDELLDLLLKQEAVQALTEQIRLAREAELQAAQCLALPAQQ